MSQQWGEKGPQVAGVAMDPTLFVAIYPENLIAIAVVVLVATMAAGLYPAWKAGRVEPVAAIKLV
jgi:ABC-type lipoprotein release transport system permease subunit